MSRNADDSTTFEPIRRLGLVLTTVTLIFFTALPGDAQTALLRGTVVDEAGNPIPGVQVTVTTENQDSFRKVLTTNKRGQIRLRFQVNQLQYTFELLFEKPGFESFIVPMSPSSVQQMDEEWVMNEGESAVVEEHGDLGAVVTGSTSEAVEAFNDGLTAQKEGNLKEARARFEAALAVDGSLGPAQLSLAQVLLDLGDDEAALAAAERADELQVNPAESLRLRHQALRALGRNAEAEELRDQLAAAQGAVALARRVYNEGSAAFQADDKTTALAKFKEAAELDPTLYDAHHAIATLEYGNGNYEAAAASAKKSLDLGSQDVRTLRVLYDAYDAQGLTDKVAEIAPRLAEIDPDFGGSKLVEQAAALWNGGQTEKALDLARLALGIDPSLGKPHYFIGLSHLSNGENSEAKAALQKFLELAPDDPEAATAREMMAYIE